VHCATVHDKVGGGSMTDVQPRRPLPAKLAGHPSVRAVLARRESEGETVTGRRAPVLDAAWLRELCLAAGPTTPPRYHWDTPIWPASANTCWPRCRVPARWSLWWSG
jgi:hypothetical protein